MADLGNLNFGVHLKDYTEQEYEAIKKKTCEYARHDQCKGWIKSRYKGD